MKINNKVVKEEDYVECIKGLNVKKCIILQNSIEKIVSVKPHALPLMLEEISGSIRFKNIYDRINDEIKKVTGECKSFFKRIKIKVQNQKEIEMEKEKKKALENFLTEKKTLAKEICIIQINEKEEKIRNDENAINTATEKEKSIKVQIKKIGGELAILRAKIKESQISYFDVKNKYKNTLFYEDGNLEKVKRQKEIEKEKVEKELRKIKVEIEKEKSSEIIKKVNDIRDEYNILLCEFKTERKEILEEEEKLRKLLDEINENENELKKFEKLFEKNKTLMKGKTRRIVGLKQKVDEKNVDELVSLRKKEMELNEILGQFLQHKNYIKIKEDKDQIIKTLKALFPGVKGKLGDLITINQNRYIIPIEVLLGNNSRVVVTETKDIALKCIKYLEKKKLCKFVFFPIDNMKVKGKTSLIRNCVRAIDCITFEKGLQNIVERVFHNSYVMSEKNIDRNPNCRYVTHDGVLFHKGALITGGPVKISLNHNLIKELNEVNSKISAFSHLNVIVERIEEINEESKITQIEQKVLEKGISSLKRKIEAIKQDNPFLNAKLSKINKRLEKEKSKKFKNILKGFSSIEELESFLNCEKIKTKEKERRNLITEFLEIIRELNSEIKELEIKTEAKENEQNLKVDFEKKNLQLKGNKQKFEEKREENEKVVRVLNRVSREILFKKNEVEKLESEKEEILHFAILEEVISKEETSDFVEGNINEKEERLRFLNVKIDEIYQTTGSSNPLSKSEERELKKLQGKYDEKKRELLDLRSELREIKRNRLALFNECYGKISDYLHNILVFFSQSAQLTCTNRNEPYLSDIKYFVLKDEYKIYDELSGGEKSIALLCFILAVNKYLNAPFYFFDEVDSALDKRHLLSLSDYFHSNLKEGLFKDDQFICISLKKDFFVNASSLIGVYKAEGGSKILGYRIKEQPD